MKRSRPTRRKFDKKGLIVSTLVLGEKKLKTGLKFSRETVKNAVIRRNCKTGFSVLVKPDFRQTNTVKVGYFDIFPVAHTYP